MQMKTEYSTEKMREIGARIKEARRKRGLNQGQLCDRVRVPSIKVISKYELGLDVPKGDRLEKIAKTLNVTVDYLLNGDREENAATEHAAVPAVPGYIEAEKPETQADEKVAKKAECITDDISLTEPSVVPVQEQIAVRETRAVKSEYLYPDDKALKKYRRKSNLEVEDIADLCGVSKWTVKSWERGQRRFLRKDAELLAELYGIQPDALIKKESEENTSDYVQHEKQASVHALAGNTVKKKDMGGPVHSGHGKAGGTLLPEPAGEQQQKPSAPKAEHPYIPAKGNETTIIHTSPKSLFEIPENPRERFCRNTIFHASEMGVPKEEFEKNVGRPLDYFQEVLQSGEKIPLDVLLKTAGFLGKSIEELSCGEDAEMVKKQIMDIEQQLRALKEKIGV